MTYDLSLPLQERGAKAQEGGGLDWRWFRLGERERIFSHLVGQKNIDMPQSQYAILWEDLSDLDDPARVTRPSPCWLAMAMNGGILPPVEVYHKLTDDEAQPDFKRHTRGHLLHKTEPMPAMTEEQAIEYLVQMVVPRSVWRDYKGNRSVLKIVPMSMVPRDRSFRNAWAINQEVA